MAIRTFCLNQFCVELYDFVTFYLYFHHESFVEREALEK